MREIALANVRIQITLEGLSHSIEHLEENKQTARSKFSQSFDINTVDLIVIRIRQLKNLIDFFF